MVLAIALRRREIPPVKRYTWEEAEEADIEFIQPIGANVPATEVQERR